MAHLHFTSLLLICSHQLFYCKPAYANLCECDNLLENVTFNASFVITYITSGIWRWEFVLILYHVYYYCYLIMAAWSWHSITILLAHELELQFYSFVRKLTGLGPVYGSSLFYQYAFSNKSLTWVKLSLCCICELRINTFQIPYLI